MSAHEELTALRHRPVPGRPLSHERITREAVARFEARGRAEVRLSIGLALALLVASLGLRALATPDAAVVVLDETSSDASPSDEPSDGDVTPTDEASDTEPTLVRVVPPDLRVEPADRGVLIANRGDGDAGGFVVRVVDAPAAMGSDFEVRIPSLAAGETRFIELYGCRTESTRVVADADGQVTEADESNNELTLSPDCPDLTLTLDRLGRYIVVNNGPGDARAFTVRAISDSGARLSEQRLRGLAAGERLEVKPPGCNKDGGTLVVDADDEVEEHTERNNKLAYPGCPA